MKAITAAATSNAHATTTRGTLYVALAQLGLSTTEIRAAKVCVCVCVCVCPHVYELMYGA